MLTTLSNWASLCTDISDKLCKSSQKKAWFCKIRLSPKLVTTTCQYFCTNMSIISVIFRKSSSQKHNSTQFHHHHPGIHGRQKPVPAARSPDRLEHLPCRLFTHGCSQVLIRVISWLYPGTSSLLYFHQTCFLILTILGKLWNSETPLFCKLIKNICLMFPFTNIILFRTLPEFIYTISTQVTAPP